MAETGDTDSGADGDADAEVPPSVVDEAERLTRLARDAVDPQERAAYERDRDERLDPYDFVARHRADDDTLVLHPAEWVVDGDVHPDRIDDVDRAVERPLTDAGDEDDWAAAEAHNAALVDAVREATDERHAQNARAFADFMGNHYARRVETASAGEIREFLDEYYPRNAWPTDEERAVVAESLAALFEAADADLPDFSAVRR
jgi:hypothetical protein